jgi:anti-anti-sigma factor
MNAELIDGIYYIQTSGYFNQELGQNVLKKCTEEMANGHAHFLIDMKDSKMVNSIGVSMLIEVIEKLEELDGSLSFCSLAPVVDKTFKIMGLVKYAKIFADKETAISELSA